MNYSILMIKEKLLAMQCIRILVISIFCFSDAYNKPLCEVTLTKCPEIFNNDTLFVSSDVVALSSRIHICDLETLQHEIADTSNPPSIMFLIDNSKSMKGNVDPDFNGNDINGLRFTVTRSLIDTISKVFPNARVGVAVFVNTLYFNGSDDSLFTILPTQNLQYPNQAYVPLLKLDSIVKPYTFQNGKMFLKNILNTQIISSNQNGGIIGKSIDLVYQPDPNTIDQGTNINLAFNAALDAFSKSTDENDRRFIVFLSDGLPDPVDSSSYHFVKGMNVPATFTVFFNSKDTIVPSKIIDMKENIRNNKYSSVNQLSDAWVVNATTDNVMKLIMDRIVKKILYTKTGMVKKLEINKSVSVMRDSNVFFYNKRFPLNDSSTHFNMNLTYSITNSITTQKYDSTVQSKFTIVRKNGVHSEGLGISCWEQGKIAFYYKDTMVNVLKETMTDSLEIRFFPQGEPYDRVQLVIAQTSGIIHDKDTLTLKKTGQYWSVKFAHEIVTAVKPGDKILQHYCPDSIVVSFRNPELPLDTVVSIIPFATIKTMNVTNVAFCDRNSDGYVDSVFFSASMYRVDSTDIPVIKSMIQWPEFRKIIVDSLRLQKNGFICFVKEQRTEPPVTSILQNDIISFRQVDIFDEFSANIPLIPIDRMAPVIIDAFVNYGTVSGNDSISIQFSEELFTTPVTGAFHFANKLNAPVSAMLSMNGKLIYHTYSTIIIPDDSVTFLENGDRIWINHNSGICDSSGNYQKNPQNRRGQIAVKISEYAFFPKVINNPYSPDSATFKIPHRIRELYRQAGMSAPSSGLLIIVESSKPVRQNLILQGSMSVFDIAKNTIMENVPVLFDNRTKRLVAIWDGYNRYRRKAAAGTYLAVLKISDGNQMKMVQTVRVGIKR
jgi:hypothetical protein